MAKFETNWLDDRSDEAVLAEIRRVAALMPDRRLTKDAFNSQSKIKSSAIEIRFGSWSEATRRAGLIDALPDYSDAAIIEDLRRISESFPNGPFTIAFYSAQGRYSPSCVKRRFGGWREALDAAGVGSRFVGPFTTERMRSQPGRTMSDEEILAQIRDVAARLDKACLSGADIVANSEISQSQLFRRFGSVSKALRQAGIKQVSHGRRHTEDEVFENLLEVWTHYGRPPTVSEMDKPPSTVGKNTYIHRYGGWRKALKAFVERANSEADGDPAHDLKQDTSNLVGRTGPTKSTTTSAAGPSRPQSVSQIIARPRITRPAPTNIKPEDRRDPNIGLRYKVLQRDRFRCQRCGRSPATELGCRLHVDHIIPFSKGGKTTFENLRALCVDCNVGKSNRSV
ncbi:MAG: HNH endonuclease [Candidatus Aureabacteria bacterium]|nr:HNH endonuclease [Candidatus Auribacterota bacterium]